ncbi:MAG: CopG family transcriptional regulator [Candidatus Sumerlaeaceae bacterium]
MSKTVTLRLDEQVYQHLRSAAHRENRPLSNFIETSVLRYLEEQQYADDFEMKEIGENRELNSRLNKAYRDLKGRKGKFV